MFMYAVGTLPLVCLWFVGGKSGMQMMLLPISTMYLFSNDIGMKINVDKSAKLIVSRDRGVTSVNFKLNSLGAIKDVHRGYVNY